MHTRALAASGSRTRKLAAWPRPGRASGCRTSSPAASGRTIVGVALAVGEIVALIKGVTLGVAVRVGVSV